jgi:hypothetical protein
MHGNSHSSIHDIRLLELVDAIADLFPLNAAIRQVGEAAAPELFINWRTEGVLGRTGNLSWGVLFRFSAGTIEQYGSLEDAARELARHKWRHLAQDLRFSYDGSDPRSLFVLDVPVDLFDVFHSDPAPTHPPADENQALPSRNAAALRDRIPDSRDK